MGGCYTGSMDTPAYNGLNFTHRMAVRHAVLAPRNLAALSEQPGALEKAIEDIAANPEQLQKAVKDYQQFAKLKAQQVRLPF